MTWVRSGNSDQQVLNLTLFPFIVEITKSDLACPLQSNLTGTHTNSYRDSMITNK